MAIDATAFVQPLANDRTSLAKIVVVDFTFDDDYEDGGAAVDLGALGLSEVWFASIEQNLAASAESAYRFVYNYADSTIQAFIDNDAGASDEVATSTGSSVIDDVVARCFFYGLGA